MISTSIRPRRVLAIALCTAAMSAVAACGGSGDDTSTQATDTATVATDAPPADSAGDLTTDESTGTDSGAGDESEATGNDETDAADTGADTGSQDGPAAADDADAPDLGRVVALAEEILLADLLTLGIEPIASSATVESVGFQGLDDFDTDAIEVLPTTTLSLEYLASLRPDTIITLQFWVDQVGADALEGIADVIVVPDGLNGVERLDVIADLVGRPDAAAVAAAAFDDALAAAQEIVPDDCTVSLAAIYAGPSVAAFVDGPWEIPTSIMAAGCELDPGADAAEADRNGRAWLSLEELGILDSETLVLMQTDTVEGEDAAVAEIEASPLWSTLPAVANGRTLVFDRLGYPGLHGQIRFLDEFSAAVAG